MMKTILLAFLVSSVIVGCAAINVENGSKPELTGKLEPVNANSSYRLLIERQQNPYSKDANVTTIDGIIK